MRQNERDFANSTLKLLHKMRNSVARMGQQQFSPGQREAPPHRHQLKDRYRKKAEVPSELVLAKTFQLWKKELPHGHLNKGSECLEERFSSGC